MSTATSTGVSTETVRELVDALGSLAPAADDAERIERIRLLEELKSVAAAAQAVETRDFARSQRVQQAVDGVPAGQQGRGIAEQIGLARRISPWAARRWIGWASVLTRELPATFAALRAGRISEWRATLVARETIWLSAADRARVDADLAPRLEGWGDRRVEAEARRAAARLDPQGAVERSSSAARDRRVTLRPAPETMCRLTALLPVAQGVASYHALCRAADSTTAGGDDRGRGQIMADTLVQRLTGQAAADAVPVEIELVITDRALLGRPGADGYDEPAELIGGGPIPAGLARELALGTGVSGDPAPRWLRRLFLHPDTGQLAAMESTRRLFTDAQRRFVRLRDRSCRTPWCDAPIRHIDHLVTHGRGGATDIGNAAGLCAACNHAKQAPGWSTTPDPGGAVTVTTPTGHRYLGRSPGPPGCAPASTADPPLDAGHEALRSRPEPMRDEQGLVA